MESRPTGATHIRGLTQDGRLVTRDIPNEPKCPKCELTHDEGYDCCIRCGAEERAHRINGFGHCWDCSQ